MGGIWCVRNGWWWALLSSKKIWHFFKKLQPQNIRSDCYWTWTCRCMGEKTVATKNLMWTLSTPRLDAPKSKNVRNFGEHVTLWQVKHCWHWGGIVDKVHHPSGLVKYYTCLLCFYGNMERFFVGAAGVILGPKSHSWEYKSNIVGRSLGFLTIVSILHVQRLFWLVYWKTGHSFFEAASR